MRRGHGAVTHEESNAPVAVRRIGYDADASVETDTDRGLMKPSCMHELI